MSVFAKDTTVAVERSRAEIERMLTRYGASKFASGWDERGATIMFEASNRRIRFSLALPLLGDKRFDRDGRGSTRNPAQRIAAREQACRQKWRALALVIKAKLEAVDSGITSFETEFLAHVVLPNGGTVGECVGAQLAAAYESGAMPPLLLGTGAP